MDIIRQFAFDLLGCLVVLAISISYIRGLSSQLWDRNEFISDLVRIIDPNSKRVVSEEDFLKAKTKIAQAIRERTEKQRRMMESLRELRSRKWESKN